MAVKCIKARDVVAGMQFGNLTAVKLDCIGYAGKNNVKTYYWEFSCACGNTGIVRSVVAALRGQLTSCGCKGTTGKLLLRDLKPGMQFERLTAVREHKKAKSITYWYFTCSCDNNIKEHSIRAHSVLGGKTFSCGCYHTEKTSIILKEAHTKGIAKLSLGSLEGTIVSGISNTTKLQKNNTSGVRGVCKSKGRFIAHIGFKGKRYKLGTFDTLDEATKARKQAEADLYLPFIEWYERHGKKELEAVLKAESV